MAIDQYGQTCKIGWIIGGLWLTVYRVERMEIPAS